MANKTLGNLIKKARTAAGLTQEKLAKAAGVTAQDISKAERGESTLTQEQLKKIAKATGVTQSSLLNAGKSTAKKTTASKKTTVKKTTTAKKTTSSSSALTLTVTEKKLVEAYRAADSDTKKAALALLKGKEDETGLFDTLLKTLTASRTSSGGLADTLGGLLGNLIK